MGSRTLLFTTVCPWWQTGKTLPLLLPLPRSVSVSGLKTRTLLSRGSQTPGHGGARWLLLPVTIVFLEVPLLPHYSQQGPNPGELSRKNCAATESQRNPGSRGCLQSLCFSLRLLFIFNPSERTRRFYFKAYWQLQQHLTVPEHSSVHRSRCHITALGMVSAGRVESEQQQQQNPCRGFVSPALTHGLPSSCLREGTRRGTPSASAAGVAGGGGGGVGELAVLVPASGRGAVHTCTHVAFRAGHGTNEGSVSPIDPRRVWQRGVLSKSVLTGSWQINGFGIELHVLSVIERSVLGDWFFTRARTRGNDSVILWVLTCVWAPWLGCL